MIDIIDNDEFRDICFSQSGFVKKDPFVLEKKDKLPIAVEHDFSLYYLDQNSYIGLGYWNPSSFDPNVLCSVEYKRGATKALRNEINNIKKITAFYYSPAKATNNNSK